MKGLSCLYKTDYPVCFFSGPQCQLLSYFGFIGYTDITHIRQTRLHLTCYCPHCTITTTMRCCLQGSLKCLFCCSQCAWITQKIERSTCGDVNDGQVLFCSFPLGKGNVQRQLAQSNSSFESFFKCLHWIQVCVTLVTQRERN